MQDNFTQDAPHMRDEDDGLGCARGVFSASLIVLPFWLFLILTAWWFGW